MHQRWTELTFIHWAYEEKALRPHIPDELTIDTFDGKAWLGLTPFVLTLALPRTPPLPGLALVPETNLRTYVRDGNGRGGIWFFSLDLPALWAVVAARATFWLPYMWSEMTVRTQQRAITYRGHRRGGRASYDISVAPGAEITPGDFENFLTARWRLFTKIGRLFQVRVEHEPWPLSRARVLRLDQELVEAAGLPPPAGRPLAHFSTGVSVRVDLPRPV